MCSFAMLQPNGDQDSGYGEIIESPPSLWRRVEEQVPASERAEIRRILGEEAVDLSLELHAEIAVLLDLWRDLRSNFSSPSPLSVSNTCPLLADPPVIKNMVTQEIRMLLLAVRQKAWRNGQDADKVLSKYNPKVVNFVIDMGRPESRTGSTRSRESGRSWLEGQRPSSSLSTNSSIDEDLEELKQKLKISHIDEVVGHLRSLLEEECRTLEKDIACLQERLEEEYVCAAECQTPLPEPSLSELKEERRLIKKDLQRSQTPVTPVPSHKHSTTLSRTGDLGSGTESQHQHSRVPYLQFLPGTEKDRHTTVAPHKVQLIKKISCVPVTASYHEPCTVKDHEKFLRVGGGPCAPSTSPIASHRCITNSSTARHKDLIYNVPAPPRGHHKSQMKVPAEEEPNPPIARSGLDYVLVPAPPSRQKPDGSTRPLTSYRRLRTPQPNPSM